MAIPTQEPTQVTAGDTIKWTRSLADYPAGTWTLSYSMVPIAGAGVVISFTASASGTDHLIEVTPAESVAWLAGEYSVQGYVTDGTDRYRAFSGPIEVLPDYQTAGAIDTRSDDRRKLDLVNATIEKLIKKQATKATIEGVQFEFQDLDKLWDIRDKLMAKVSAEELTVTGGTRRSILASFTSPS